MFYIYNLFNFPKVSPFQKNLRTNFPVIIILHQKNYPPFGTSSPGPKVSISVPLPVVPHELNVEIDGPWIPESGQRITWVPWGNQRVFFSGVFFKWCSVRPWGLKPPLIFLLGPWKREVYIYIYITQGKHTFFYRGPRFWMRSVTKMHPVKYG